jgi:isocitrate/isopropylmalate dehydrogenase
MSRTAKIVTLPGDGIGPEVYINGYQNIAKVAYKNKQQ